MDNIDNKTNDQYINCYDEIEKNIQICDLTKEHKTFQFVVSNRKIVGKVITVIKKIIKKCTIWYIDPICKQQTIFNESALSILQHLIKVVFCQNKRISAVEKSYENALESISGIENYEKDYTKRISEIELRLTRMEQVQALSNNKIVKLDNICNRFLDMGIETASSHQMSYSQAGEDMIILYILAMKQIAVKNCMYLDLGANHAREINNTYRLYQLGARGVLVEANPDLIAELKFYRPEDQIVNACIAEESNQQIEFYVMNGDGVSTCNKENVDNMMAINPYLQIEKIIRVNTITVRDILNQYFVGMPTILNIDLEGLEMRVLEGIDFEQYRPLIIIVEMIPYMPSLVIGRKNETINQYLQLNGYTEYAFTGINSIFINIRDN